MKIINNNKQARQFITGIVKAQVQSEEKDDTTLVNVEPINVLKRLGPLQTVTRCRQGTGTERERREC